jgi:beta-glucosidase
LPGLEGGPAVADILAGAINPSGKLPFTYPGDVNDIVPYDHRWTDVQDPQFGTESFRPQFEFGHGLSYTTFEYSDLMVDNITVDMGGTINVTVNVANTGDRAGKEVVQLFTTDKVASITPSVKRLRAFEKIALNPGETRALTFTLSTRDLAFVGRDNTWVTEPGEFSVSVGGLTADFEVE